MTSPLCTLCDEFLHASLAHIVGARIDAAYLVAETGLVVLALYKGHKVLLAAGIGPVCAGIGLLPRLPQGSAGIEHPLVAAMRAHLVKSFVLTISVENNTVIISTENSSQPFPARLAIEPGRHGNARVFTPTGAVVTWPVVSRQTLGPPTNSPNMSLESAGIKLVETSDSYRIETFYRQLAGILRKKRQRLERRAAAVQKDLDRLADVPHLQKIGSLLLAHGQTIPRGTTKTSLVDWGSNEPIDIELAPDKPAIEQAAAFFQKARRLQRGAPVMTQRHDETIRAINALEPLETALKNAPANWITLQEIADRMLALGLSVYPPTIVSPAKQLAPEERKPYHTFRSSNGSAILVGRSSQDNDALVTRIAKPHDLWLHAKNIRGAHVVVPLEKNRSCPADVLVDAATLAAHFSDARNESMCEISYVERRYVRKPRKSAPGLVMTQREKVMVVRMEKGRLSRLLGSKVET